jgi:hypothetical protein
MSSSAGKRIFLIAAIIVISASQQALAADLPVIEVHSGDRYFQTAEGDPFFWLADTAWSLFRLTPDELDEYYAVRSDQGFTVIQGPVLVTDSPNYDDETNGDPENPNEAWFEHIDEIIVRAANHGLYVSPVLGWGDIADRFDDDSAYSFGFYVGERYREETNIAAFVLAGEFNYPSSNVALWTSMAEGLLDGLDGAQRLITLHPRWYGGYDGQTTSADFGGADWLSFNMVQSSVQGDCTDDPAHSKYLGTHNWLLIKNDWQGTPRKPVIDAEPTYEAQDPYHPSCDFNPDFWDDFGCRRRAYWAIFAGAAGHTYGANGVYQFHKEDDPNPVGLPEDYWEQAVEYSGAEQMGYLRRLIESRPYFKRIGNQKFLVSPADDGHVKHHIHSTRDKNNNWAMVYVPRSDHTLTVDMDLIKGDQQKAWWFNPSTGNASVIGTFDEDDYSSNGTMEFTTPANGSEDWVLVVDNASKGFGPPGD